jgi:hypothetical protein
VNLTCYRYDRKFCAYVGAVRVAPSTYADGRQVYELPPHSTLVEPPYVEDGEAAVWIDKTQTWVIVSDHRGETWVDYAGRPQAIDRLGDPKQWGMFPREERPREQQAS